MFSAIIPTLNAADVLPRMLGVLRDGSIGEIIVVDGGSTDATGELATKAGARLVEAPRGRGSQLAAGAETAKGDWLLFIHADSVPDPGWAEAIAAFAEDARNRDRAAYFRFALDDDTAQARRLEALVDWRCRVLGLPYGDQGLLIGRAHYFRLGGYRPLPLMEDVDLVRRIGIGQLTRLPIAARTSAWRWRAQGWWLRSARNLTCLALYFLRVPPSLIARIYD
jgi:rSAM/selenodomain-associated transferase 2